MAPWPASGLGSSGMLKLLYRAVFLARCKILYCPPAQFGPVGIPLPAAFRSQSQIGPWIELERGQLAISIYVTPLRGFAVPQVIDTARNVRQAAARLTINSRGPRLK